MSVNFQQDRLVDVLNNAGFDPTAPTLFIWEGVTYYLTEEAVTTTLSFIKNNSPIGSSLCFDYLTEPLESVNPAEPFLFWIAQSNIAKFLADQGFKIMEQLGTSEMEKIIGILRIPNGKRPLVAIAIGWPERTLDAVTGATTRNADMVN